MLEEYNADIFQISFWCNWRKPSLDQDSYDITHVKVLAKLDDQYDADLSAPAEEAADNV